MNGNAIEDRLMTVEELAAYLNLKPGTIYNRVSQRTIPFEKVGRSVRFRRSTIDEWIKSNPVAEESGSDDEPERASA